MKMLPLVLGVLATFVSPAFAQTRTIYSDNGTAVRYQGGNVSNTMTGVTGYTVPSGSVRSSELGLTVTPNR